MEELVGALVKAVVMLFVALDPLGTIPYYQALTSGFKVEEKRRVLRLAILVAWVILLAFTVLGDALFRLFNLTIDDFKVAAGLVLLIASIALLLEVPLGILRAEPEKVAIVPIATPLLAGPAAISITLLLRYTWGPHVALLAVTVNMLIAYLILASSNFISRIVGRQGLVVFDKFMSLIMATLAVSLIRQGLAS